MGTKAVSGKGHISDLSASGMFIATDSPRRPGERFRLVFSIPDSGPEIIAEAEVVWAREPGSWPPDEQGMGVRFLGISDDAAVRIRSFVGGEAAGGTGDR